MNEVASPFLSNVRHVNNIVIQQLQLNSPRLQSAPPTDPIVLCAADDHYVMPLAVTLHSAATALGEGHHLHVILMDGGISESNYGGLAETLAGLPSRSTF